MPLPYPENLTPDAPPYSTVQINEYWWSVIFGFADNALLRENWDVTDAQWEDEVKPAIINALDTAMNCDCIEGLGFDPVTGKLTYTDENGNTVVVKTEGDTFISNTYYVITKNEADADDAYCYAAGMLSERVSDDLQDMLEVLDVLEDFTLSVYLEVMASMIDLVPFFGDVGETAIRITDNLLEVVADWVKDNIRDIQAREKAAEIFYCGIKRAMENGGQTSIRSEILIAGGTPLVEFVLSFIDDVWEIPDLLPVFTDAYDALDAELLGYSIVAWFLLTDAAMEAVGADRPLEAIIAKATKYAASFDDRDCSSFECDPWCFLFDFTLGDELGWTIRNHSEGPPLGEWNGNKFSSIDQFLAGRYRRWLRLTGVSFPAQVITSVKVFYDYTACTVCGAAPNLAIEFVLATVVTSIPIVLTEGTNQETTLVVSELCDVVSPNFIVGWRIIAPTNGGINVHKIEICGEDSNPF